MKLKFRLTITILLILVPVCLSCKAKLKTGNEVVNKIENFKKAQGKLPETMSEIGIEEKEDSSIHYKKESETKYVLWFGTTLGESVTYDSGTRDWK